MKSTVETKAEEIANFARNHSGNWDLLEEFAESVLARYGAELEAELRKTLEVVQANRETDFVNYADYTAKNEALQAQLDKTQAVLRNIRDLGNSSVTSRAWFKTLEIVEAYFAASTSSTAESGVKARTSRPVVVANQNEQDDPGRSACGTPWRDVE